MLCCAKALSYYHAPSLSIPTVFIDVNIIRSDIAATHLNWTSVDMQFRVWDSSEIATNFS